MKLCNQIEINRCVYFVKVQRQIIFPKPRYISGNLGNKGIGFWQNHKITVLPYLGREFRIQFKMVIQPRSTGWRSVLHFTTGGNFPRIPAVFIGDNNLLNIHHIHNLRDQKLTNNNKKVVKHNKPVGIEIRQELRNDKVCD